MTEILKWPPSSEGFDCEIDAIWVCLNHRDPLSIDLLQGEVLQNLDWELNGQIMRALKTETPTLKAPILIPTFWKKGAAWVVLQFGPLSLDEVKKRVKEASWRRVYLLSETPSFLPVTL